MLAHRNAGRREDAMRKKAELDTVAEDTRRRVHGLSRRNWAILAKANSKMSLNAPALASLRRIRPADWQWAISTTTESSRRSSTTRASRLLLVIKSNKPAGHWVRIELEGTCSNRSAIGARVLLTAGGITQVDEVRSGGSYLSQSELSLHFGLGGARCVDRVKIRWPNGLVEEKTGLEVDRPHKFKEPHGNSRGAPAGAAVEPAEQMLDPKVFT